jgi:plastocyanin
MTAFSRFAFAFVLIVGLAFVPFVNVSTPTVGAAGIDETTLYRSADQAAGGQSVTIQDFAFNPASLSVNVGTAVTWTNKDSVPHTVTSTSPDIKFDSGPIQPGGTFSFTFSQAGTVQYHCTIHPNMVASIEVTQGTAAAPAVPSQGEMAQNLGNQPSVTAPSIGQPAGTTVVSVWGPGLISRGLASPAQFDQTYVVKRGDTLGSIARMFGTTVIDLVTVNGIANPSLIRGGLSLKVPGTGMINQGVSAAPSAQPAAPSVQPVQPAAPNTQGSGTNMGTTPGGTTGGSSSGSTY